MKELMELLKTYDKLYYEWAKKCGMSETAFYIMMGVWEMDGECTQTDICEQWSMSRQTVNSAAKALERDGYLELILQDFGRKKTMLFTGKGRDFATNYIEPMVKMDDTVWESLPKSERDACIAVVTKHLQRFGDRIKDDQK